LALRLLIVLGHMAASNYGSVATYQKARPCTMTRSDGDDRPGFINQQRKQNCLASASPTTGFQLIGFAGESCKDTLQSWGKAGERISTNRLKMCGHLGFRYLIYQKTATVFLLVQQLFSDTRSIRYCWPLHPAPISRLSCDSSSSETTSQPLRGCL
jgi:hypothetical protein